MNAKASPTPTGVTRRPIKVGFQSTPTARKRHLNRRQEMGILAECECPRTVRASGCSPNSSEPCSLGGHRPRGPDSLFPKFATRFRTRLTTTLNLFAFHSTSTISPVLFEYLQGKHASTAGNHYVTVARVSQAPSAIPPKTPPQTAPAPSRPDSARKSRSSDFSTPEISATSRLPTKVTGVFPAVSKQTRNLRARSTPRSPMVPFRTVPK
jgi:hypothetical protein